MGNKKKKKRVKGNALKQFFINIPHSIRCRHKDWISITFRQPTNCKSCMNKKLCNQFLHKKKKKRNKDLSLKFTPHYRKSLNCQKNCNFEERLQVIGIFIYPERICSSTRKLCLQRCSGWGSSTRIITEWINNRKEACGDCLLQLPCSKWGQLGDI